MHQGVNGMRVAQLASRFVEVVGEKVARAGCATFMIGYQTTDGVPITLAGEPSGLRLRLWPISGTLAPLWRSKDNRIAASLAKASRVEFCFAELRNNSAGLPSSKKPM